MKPVELLVATKNAKKLSEIGELLRGLPVKLTSLADYPLAPRIIENGATFAENAKKKALKIAAFSEKLTVGEDSGLCVDALDDAPGVRSARFSGSGKDDEANNRKLLRLLKDVKPSGRGAGYVCAVAIADKDGLLAVVEGTCRGRIALQPAGKSGFGYDPLFLIPRYAKTFAELGEKVKHTMSHRYRALKKAAPVLRRCIERRRS
ncbi:MAG: RdgB/HAM1 family non-canonical purine NTP pyrophosphatase [Candidatus Omnitrophota bacterium]